MFIQEQLSEEKECECTNIYTQTHAPTFREMKMKAWKRLRLDLISGFDAQKARLHFTHVLHTDITNTQRTKLMQYVQILVLLYEETTTHMENFKDV